MEESHGAGARGGEYMGGTLVSANKGGRKPLWGRAEGTGQALVGITSQG